MGHIHQRIDFTASVYVVFEGKVLLHMHKIHKMWLPPGGHIELDEDPVEAAIREAKEEVGLDVKIIGETMPVGNEIYNYREIVAPRHLGRHDISSTHEHVVFVYYAVSETDEVKVSHHDHEKAETQWCSLEDLNTMDLLPNVRFYAKEALEELGE